MVVQRGWIFNDNVVNEQVLQNEFGLSNKQAYDQFMYVVKTMELGWVNIDCLWNSSNAVTMKIDEKPDSTISAMIIFKRRKAVFPANDNLMFSGIPGGEPAVVLAIKRANEKIYTSLIETETGNKNIALNFKETSAEELRIQLLNLNI